MITIYSSFASDKILNEKGRLVSIKEKGGPAFYIGRVFKKSGLPYILKAGKPIEVEIKLLKNQEVGKVKQKIKARGIILKNNDPVLISTIGKEWVLGNNVPENTKVFLDIQGYVRDLKHFGQKTFFNSPFLENVFCLKGTAEEINYLPKEVIKNQKSRCLIITKGSSGLVIYDRRKRFLLRPKQKIQCKNTLGAGDTLFAYFVNQFLKTNDVFKSAQCAVKKTFEFLSTKAN